MEMDGEAVNFGENSRNTPNMPKSKDILQRNDIGEENKSTEALKEAIVATCVSMLHMDLTDRLKPVAGVRYEVYTQNPYKARGPKKTTERPLKDISNTP